MKKLRPSGGYRDSCSFQTATRIYDSTVRFYEKFVDSRSRLVDQMVQAARSGHQNIAEGSRASATSSQTEFRVRQRPLTGAGMRMVKGFPVSPVTNITRRTGSRPLLVPLWRVLTVSTRASPG